MKILYILVLLSHLSFSQNLTYEYNKSFIYTIGNNVSAQSIVFNTAKKVPTISKNFENTESLTDNYIVEFPYHLNNKKYEFQGRAFNKKYLLASSFATNVKKLQHYNFFKTKDTYVIRKFDCQEYKAQINNTKSFLRVFTTNLKDGIDYNMVKNEVEQSLNLKLPVFEKGEIVIEVALFTLPENYEIYLKYQKSENINLEFVINKQQLEKTLGEKTNMEPIKENTPSYCLVETNQAKDETVGYKIDSFLQDMCEYFQTYGYENIEEYNTFFDQEIIRLTNKFRQYKILNKTQIEEFKSILIDYSKTNRTKTSSKIKN